MEALCFYKLIRLTLIIKHFKNEIVDHLNHYDFNKIVFKKYFQNQHFVRINFIFLVSSIRISNYKKKNTTYSIGTLDALREFKIRKSSTSS